MSKLTQRPGLGLFEDIHGAESPDAFSRQLREAARRYYGAPMREYLGFVSGNHTDAEKSIRNFQAHFVKRHVPAGATGEVVSCGPAVRVNWRSGRACNSGENYGMG